MMRYNRKFNKIMRNHVEIIDKFDITIVSLVTEDNDLIIKKCKAADLIHTNLPSLEMNLMDHLPLMLKVNIKKITL